MGLLDKIKSVFNKVFKRKNNQQLLDGFIEKTEVESSKIEETEAELSKVEETPKEKEYTPIDLPEGEIVSFDDEVLDTTSRATKEKLKHNLEVLTKKAKEEGKVDKFKIIREDDFFPDDWEWGLLSKDTNFEMYNLSFLANELRTSYALEKYGKPESVKGKRRKDQNSFSKNEIDEALSHVDKNLGKVLLPSKFRSTKHFTVNTPLAKTGDYNWVDLHRNYIVIDDMNNFLNSGYAYSVAYHDAYLDTSHENLPVSENAVVLINDEKYEELMQDEKIVSQLAQRKVIRYKGDEVDAINMVLSQMGVLPSKVNDEYSYCYDNEIKDILDSSIKKLAKDNDLFFDKFHFGILSPEGGHFSSYYDQTNRDYQNAFEEFIEFLREKFPEHEELFPKHLNFTISHSQKIIKAIGATALLDAINEHNEKMSIVANENLEKHKQDRASITPEIHDKFVSTIALINNFYKDNVRYDPYSNERFRIEGMIQKFMQGNTVEEQLAAAESIWEVLPEKISQREETTVDNSEITMETIVRNAISKGITTEQVADCDKVEQRELEDTQKEEETRDD